MKANLDCRWQFVMLLSEACRRKVSPQRMKRLRLLLSSAETKFKIWSTEVLPQYFAWIFFIKGWLQTEIYQKRAKKIFCCWGVHCSVFTGERPAEDWGAWATPTQCSARQALHYWLLVVQCIVCVCVCVTVCFILYRLLQIFQKCTKPWCRGLSILIQYCTVLRYLAFIYGIVWRFIVTVLQYFAGRCHYIATTP